MSRYKKNKPTSIDIGTELPEDRIEFAYEIYKSTLADDLLEKVKDCSWQFFEILVKDLLVAMGYGDPYDEARISKGAGDEGIDGQKLAELMIDYNVGLSCSRTYILKKIDSDYFDS
jgi:restriction endonuclease Mrr